MPRVWLRPIDDLDYVRVSHTLTRDPQGEAGVGARNETDYYHSIGYSNLDSDAEPAEIHGSTPMYLRRHFWLKNADRPLDGDPVWGQ